MRRNNSGFTLVELVVSVALLALVLVPAIGIFTDSFRIQDRSDKKTSMTRVGQYIMENFKNKNFLSNNSNENQNLRGLGDTSKKFGYFTEFIDSIDLSMGSTDFIDKVYNWEINYSGVDYLVDIEIKGVDESDISNLDVPSRDDCDGEIEIYAGGSFSDNSDTGIETYEANTSYINPINGATYVADCPTIILKNSFVSGDEANLWITNEYYDNDNKRQKEIRIIKKFTEPLNVYIEGKNLSILRGQNGDGASKDHTKITTSYVGEELENEGKENSSELILDANMVISLKDDITVSDTFDFSFPINYDYSDI